MVSSAASAHRENALNKHVGEQAKEDLIPSWSRLHFLTHDRESRRARTTKTTASRVSRIREEQDYSITASKSWDVSG